MAYYTALINEWANLPAGDTTQQKLAALNAMMVSGAVPTSFYVTGTQLLNAINWSEFAALNAAQQANVLALCNSPGQILSGSGNLTHMAAGMIIAYFPPAGITITALVALAQATAQPWWQANGYSSAFSLDDLVAAGGLT